MEKFTTVTLKQLQHEAASGSMHAQYTLGGAYYNGNGVERNPEEGAKWLHKAAEQGHVAAQCDLGAMYVKGYGVEQDYRQTLSGFAWPLNKATRLRNIASEAFTPRDSK